MNDKRQLLAVVFTDIIGFQQMTAANETRTVRLVREHRDVVRGCLEPHGGREMRTVGDAFLLLFESAVEAVRFGIAVQERMAKLNEGRPEDEQVWMRIGVHLGEVVIGHEGELYGETVNIASRVEPHAPPGGLCITDAVLTQARAHVPRAFERIGVVPLKGVERPPELYRLAVGRAAPALVTHRRAPWPLLAALTVVGALAVGVWSVWPEPPAVRVSSNPEAQRLWEEGIALWRRTDSRAATNRIRAALDLDPTSSRLLLSRAYTEEDQAASLDLRQRALAAAPDGPEGDLVRLLDRSLHAGDDPEMARAWDVWSAAHPEDEEGQFMMAMAYPAHGLNGLDSHHGGPHEHGPLLQTRAFVERFPENIQARLLLAINEFGAGNREAATAQLDEAVRQCPTCAQAHALRGQLLLADGSFEEGKRALKLAAELDPGMPGLREAMAFAATEQGDEAERVRLVETILEDGLQPASQRAQFAFGHGGQLLEAGRFRDGRGLRARGLDLADAAAKADMLLQWIQLEVAMGGFTEARALLDRLGEVISDPATPSLVRDIMAVNKITREQHLAYRLGDIDEVRRLDQRLRALPADRFPDGSRDRMLNDSTLWLAVLEGRMEDALPLLRRPAPGCGRDVTEANAFEMAGDPASAARAWEAAAADPECRGYTAPQAWVTAARIALDRGDRARATELAQKARKAWKTPDPDLPLAQQLVAIEQRLATP